MSRQGVSGVQEALKIFDFYLQYPEKKFNGGYVAALWHSHFHNEGRRRRDELLLELNSCSTIQEMIYCALTSVAFCEGEESPRVIAIAVHHIIGDLQSVNAEKYIPQTTLASQSTNPLENAGIRYAHIQETVFKEQQDQSLDLDWVSETLLYQNVSKRLLASANGEGRMINETLKANLTLLKRLFCKANNLVRESEEVLIRAYDNKEQDTKSEGRELKLLVQ